MGKLRRDGVGRVVKFAFAGMLGMAPLAIGGSASAIPAGAPAPIVSSASTDGYVTKVYDDEHNRWRSHRRHGSEQSHEHGRWSSHRRWGSEYEHNRWRSHSRHGSDGGGDYHSRDRSHHRHGSGY